MSPPANGNGNGNGGVGTLAAPHMQMDSYTLPTSVENPVVGAAAAASPQQQQRAQGEGTEDI
jgi:hypothetical protein